MKNLILLVTVILLLAFNSRGQEAGVTVDLRNRWDTIRPLANPGKGWYHHLLDNGISKYPIENDSVFLAFPGMDHLYLRLAWAYLEPEEGKFDWTHKMLQINKLQFKKPVQIKHQNYE